MYPQAILFGLAFLKKDRGIFAYAIPLSVIGAVAAGYHYLLQIGLIGSIISCSAVGYAESCAKIFINEFGYITLPMMSLTAFALIFLISVNALKVDKK